jgi:HEPN domain-containing protein
VEGVSVERFNPYPIVELAATARELVTTVGLYVEAHRVFGIKRRLDDVIATFIEQDVPMPASKDAARSMRAVAITIDDLPSMEVLGPGVAEALANSYSKLDFALYSELPESALYFVPTRRAWDTRILLSSARSMLSDAVLSGCPRRVADELDEAGRCLAFGVATAAAFHALRATELVLKSYFPVFGINPKPGEHNLGAYIRIMLDSGVDSNVVTNLDKMRTYYGNGIMHPDTVVNLEDACEIMSILPGIIRLMVSDIKVESAWRDLANEMFP